LLARWFVRNRATVSARLSERWREAATDPRLAQFRSHHQRLWGYVAGRFARGEYLIIHLTFGFAVSAIVLWVFSTITEDIIHHDPLTRFDLALASWMHRHESLAAYQFFHDVSLVGSPLVIGVIAIAVGLILIAKREWIILSGWLAAFYGGGLLGRVLEAFVQRPGMHGREAIFGGTLGLPTGHAMGSLIGYGLLAYLLVGFIVKRRSAQTAIVTAAAMLIVAIGFSRLYLGALYFSVMIGVYAAGVVWLATCITGIEIARRQRPLTASEVGLDAVPSAA